jgi:hypothetical protein
MNSPIFFGGRECSSILKLSSRIEFGCFVTKIDRSQDAISISIKSSATWVYVMNQKISPFQTIFMIFDVRLVGTTLRMPPTMHGVLNPMLLRRIERSNARPVVLGVSRRICNTKNPCRLPGSTYLYPIANRRHGIRDFAHCLRKYWGHVTSTGNGQRDSPKLPIGRFLKTKPRYLYLCHYLFRSYWISSRVPRTCGRQRPLP